MDKKRINTIATCFLSCSIRPADRPLVDAIQNRVLEPMGFKCFTVGRNVSLPKTPDDTIKKLVSACDCLIGIATARLDARDRGAPDRTLTIATPYLLQETSMAFQAGLPRLILRTPEVALDGVLRQNLWLDIRAELKNERPVFVSSKAAVSGALQALHADALKYREAKARARRDGDLGTLAKFVVGVATTWTAADFLLRPDCFGQFYYADPECKGCSYKPRCKAEKARNNG